jgi:hypothetical protein
MPVDQARLILSTVIGWLPRPGAQEGHRGRAIRKPIGGAGGIPMNDRVTALLASAFVLALAGQAHALVVCAKDDGTGQPKEKSKLVLKAACTSGKEVPIGIAVTGTVGVDANVQFYGSNVQVVSGLGSTEAAPNGLGNLIVGYNEATSGQTRTGSNNLVVGSEHEYLSYGETVLGKDNKVTAPYATVTAGSNNFATADFASVSGGASNTATGVGATVSGGAFNTAGAVSATVSGGDHNTASNGSATVSGGSTNTASGTASVVSGGSVNVASGDYSSVSGGLSNTAFGSDSAVSGGVSVTAALGGVWHAGQSVGFPTGTQY